MPLPIGVRVGSRQDFVTLTSASDKSNFALDIEQIAELELIIVGRHFAR